MVLYFSVVPEDGSKVLIVMLPRGAFAIEDDSVVVVVLDLRTLGLAMEYFVVMRVCMYGN